MHVTYGARDACVFTGENWLVLKYKLKVLIALRIFLKVTPISKYEESNNNFLEAI